MGMLLSLIAGMLRKPDAAPLPPPLQLFPWHAKYSAANEPIVLEADDQVAAFDRIFANR